MILHPDSNGEALVEVNHCHGKGSGHPCTGPQSGLGRDAFVPMPTEQTRVPRTGAEAAYLMGRNYAASSRRRDRAAGYAVGGPVLRAAYDKDSDEAEKNWAKHLVGTVEKVRPEVFAAVETAMADNAKNLKFMRIVKRFGDDGTIAVPLPEKDDGPFSNSAAAQRFGQMSVVFDSFWFKGKDMAKRDAPEPGVGTAESYGGMAAVLRHEYGHHVHNSLTSETRRVWSGHISQFIGDSGWGKYDGLKDKITTYSAQNAEEAFTETFAIWSDPKFNRTKYPADVQHLFDFMDHHFAGKRIIERRR